MLESFRLIALSALFSTLVGASSVFALELQYTDTCFGQCGIKNPEEEIVDQHDDKQIALSLRGGFYRLRRADGSQFVTRDEERMMQAIYDENRKLGEEPVNPRFGAFLLRYAIPNKSHPLFLRQSLFRLDRALETCQSLEGLASASMRQECTLLRNSYSTDREKISREILRLEKAHQNCFGSHPVFDSAPAILSSTRKTLDRWKVDGKFLGIDGAYCNTATGVVSSLMDELGFTRGQDYLVQGSEAHVFITLPKEGKIIDPTFAQFFNKGSEASKLLLAQNGFAGTPEDLWRFVDEHQGDLKFCKSNDDCRQNALSRELNGAFAITDSAKRGAELKRIFAHMWFGDKIETSKSPIVEAALEMSQLMSQRAVTPFQAALHPEEVQMDIEIDHFSCPAKTKEPKKVCDPPPASKIFSPFQIDGFHSTIQALDLVSSSPAVMKTP